MKLKHSVSIVLTMCLAAALAGCGGGNEAGGSTQADASGRCPHQIKQDKCPFCNPTLVGSEGYCGEHGVAEALCYQCRPYLKAAFRAKGDWCAEHNAPESQCAICNPELKGQMRPGEHGAKAPSTGGTASSGAGVAGNCEHGIAQAKCPFCTPSLIGSDGFCKEHSVAEALCVQCRPYLKTVFIAKATGARSMTPPSRSA